MFHQLLNLVYRIFAPSNPRGWITVYVEPSKLRSGTERIFTEGMQRWDLPNIEIDGVPSTITGIVHGQLIFEVIGYIKNNKQIKAGETFGIVTEQVVLEGKMAESSCVDKEKKPLLAIVDNDEANGNPPVKLLHNVIVSNCFASKYPPQKDMEQLLLALELFSGDSSKPIRTEVEADKSSHKNAATAFQLIADDYVDLGMPDKAIDALKQFCARSPFNAKGYKEFVLNGISDGTLPVEDVRSKFWKEVVL